MVDKYRLSFLFIASMTLFASGLFASPVPPELQIALQARERHLNHLSLNCSMFYKEVKAGMTPLAIRQKQTALQAKLPSELRRGGLTDENSIKQMVQSSVDSVVQSGQGSLSTSTTPCIFEHYDDQTLITTTRQLENAQDKSSEAYRYFYSGDSAMLINDGNVINDKRYPSSGTNVWKTSGKSIYYRSPNPDGIGLLPEHLAMLLGINPLKMHGAEWEMVSVTKSAYQLHCKFTADNLLPIDVQMSLDRTHSNAPSEIRISVLQGQETIALSAHSYKRFNGEWVPSELVSYNHLANLDITQNWEVKSLAASKPIALSVPPSMLIRDYRLVGSHIGNLMTTTNQEKKLVVAYHWAGNLPTLEDLKKIHDKQHPGESSPDPGKTSSANFTPLLGGMFCLIGGVWMFKRRGQS